MGPLPSTYFYEAFPLSHRELGAGLTICVNNEVTWLPWWVKRCILFQKTARLELLYRLDGAAGVVAADARVA